MALYFKLGWSCASCSSWIDSRVLSLKEWNHGQIELSNTNKSSDGYSNHQRALHVINLLPLFRAWTLQMFGTSAQ